MAALVAGCSDRTPTSPGPPGQPALAQFDCLADVQARSVTCGRLQPAGTRATMFGGQNTWVRVTSNNVKYDLASRVFSADIIVTNLSQQPMGTADGVAPDSNGVRVFFHSGPYTSSGTGSVWVENADGYGVFTASGQPFFRWTGILRPGESTPYRSWRWHVDPTVGQFAFTLYLDAQLVPLVVIDEIMAHPTTASEAAGEWIEVSNRGIGPVDLKGWTIASGGDAPHTITERTVIPPLGYVVLGGSTDRAANGGATVTYAWSGVELGNGADDWVALRLPTGPAVDSVSWGAAPSENASPPPTGISMALDTVTADNLYLSGAGSAWKASRGFFGTGQLGTPAARNLRALSAVSIAAGDRYTCALDAAGQAWCWGSNNAGQLGVGTVGGTRQVPAPMLQTGLRFIALSQAPSYSGRYPFGSGTCMVEYYGPLYCAGVLYGNDTPLPSPTGQLPGRWASVWGSIATCAIGADGSLVCRGMFGFQVTSSWAPPALTPAGAPVVAAVSGDTQACILTDAGRVWCNGSSRTLGDGTTQISSAWVAVLQPPGVVFTQLAMGIAHACALSSAGQVWCWGAGTHGEIGNGGTGTVLAPVPVTQPAGVTFTSVSAAANQTCALSLEGDAYCWGYNLYGQLGEGTSLTARMVPTRVLAPPGITFSAIDVGTLHTCALTRPYGQPACWGDNGYGELGDGTTTSRDVPVSAGG
jgi:hypothetical protein